VVCVDTNILLHAANNESPHRAGCLQALIDPDAKDESLALSWGVVYEFLRVSTHPNVFTPPLTYDEAWSFLAPLLARPQTVLLRETDRHASTMGICAVQAARLSGNRLHDFHLAVLMREHGVSDILTLDTDFRAFPWVVMRPLPS
jgi:hypothetical protein